MKFIITFLVLSTFAFSGLKSMWTQTGEMSAGNTDYVYSITASAEGVMYASSWARGIYKSTDQGMTWTFSGLSGKRVSHLSVAPNGDVYGLSITQSFSYIHRSTDHGTSWTDVFTGSFPLNYAGGGEIVYPDDGSIVAAFAVTVGPTIGDVATFVYRSTDGGNNFSRTQTIGLGFVGGMIITADKKILLGTSLGGVLYSVNNGINFTSLSGFPSIFIKTIQIAPDNTIYVSDAYGLNRSTDNGATFVDVSVPGNFSTVRAAKVNSNGDVFLSKDDRKVFKSTDRGSSWIQINDGIPATTYVNCLTLSLGRIFAGTGNSGAFVYDKITSINSVNNNADEYRLEQNYPNPFNPVTNLEFGISDLEFVSLKVYNSMGKEVTTLVNEFKPAGVFKVEFDGSNLSSGIYFYKIEAGSFVQTKRMLLLK